MLKIKTTRMHILFSLHMCSPHEWTKQLQAFNQNLATGLNIFDIFYNVAVNQQIVALSKVHSLKHFYIYS